MGKVARSRRARRAQPTEKPASAGGGRRIERFAIPLIALAGLAAYHNSLTGAFVMDDSTAIVRNASIRTLFPPWSALSPATGTPVAGRPIVNLSFAVNYAISGLRPTSYHAVNLALHVLVALVLFGIVRRTLAFAPAVPEHHRKQAPWIAASVALLWVVHPLASETVDYVTQRTELLMALFFLLTFYCALRGFESQERKSRLWIWHAGAVVAFVLGMGSKEVIVVAPFVLLAYDRLFWSESWKEAVRRHRRLYGGLLVAIVLCVALVATRFRRTFVGLTGREASPWEFALTQAGVIVHYLRLAIWPDPLVADYDGWRIARSVREVLPSLVAVAALLALTLWGLLRRSKLAFLGIFFFLVLAPTSSFRPMLSEIAAERRMYLPLAAVVTLLVLGGDALRRRLGAPPAAGAAVVAALALALMVITIRRNEDYRTTLSFWSDVVEKRPDNARARVWLGNYLDDHGRSAEAFEHMTTAVRLQPRNATAHYNLGIMLAGRGRTDEAIEHYRYSLRIQPGKAEVHNNLGISLVARGRVDEGIAQYREALRIEPGHVFAHYNMAQALVLQGRTDEAAEHLAAVVRLQPGFQAARRELRALSRPDRSRPGPPAPP